MAGPLLPAGVARAVMARVGARLTTPTAYLAVLGGLQVLLAGMAHVAYGWWLAVLIATLWFGLLAGLALVGDRWRWKLTAVSVLAVASAVLPTLAGIVIRSRRGVTSEHDGMLQVESAIDRVLHGQPVYGVDWSGTPMAGLPWDLTTGANPALHHLAYYPLTVLVGVPFRLIATAFGLGFDYRIVLIAFVLVGIGAIVALPIEPQQRFMLICAVTINPLITLYLWSGRNDIEFLACIFISLALLARQYVTAGSAVLGVALALKPFAWLAAPFLLLLLYLRWRQRRSTRELLQAGIALAAAPLLTIGPFFLVNPSAFWTDTVLYASGGIPDAYPIAGFGVGEFLYEHGVIAHRTDAFPFPVFQLAAMVPVLWLGARAFLRRPSMARWMAGYACLLFAFTFFARFFNDNYVGVVITLLLCVRPLGEGMLIRSQQRKAYLAA